MKYCFVLLFFHFSLIKCCEPDWKNYQNKNVSKYLIFLQSYHESIEFCKQEFNATFLSIENDTEQKFLTFYSFRYLNVTQNIWIQTPLRNSSLLNANLFNKKMKVYVL